MEEMRQTEACCFLGHREFYKTEELSIELYKIIEQLILTEKVRFFLFGSKSSFNAFAYEIVTVLRERYPHIKRVYVRAEYPFIDDNYKNYLLTRYEDTYYPVHMVNAGRASYIERNCEMIEKSHYCVFYYNRNHIPSGKKGSRTSGTAMAYVYACKKSCQIINVFKEKTSP